VKDSKQKETVIEESLNLGVIVAVHLCPLAGQAMFLCDFLREFRLPVKAEGAGPGIPFVGLFRFPLADLQVEPVCRLVHGDLAVARVFSRGFHHHDKAALVGAPDPVRVMVGNGAGQQGL